jgi:hypothetical protein
MQQPRFPIYVLLAVFLFAYACSDHDEEAEYNVLRQEYMMLPFTDIERETGGLDSLFIVYDSLQKPLDEFIARYAEGERVNDASAWRSRIQMRKKYWEEIRGEFYKRMPDELLHPKNPADYCRALSLLDTLRNELQYKEPVITEVLSRDLEVMAATMKRRRAEVIKEYLASEARAVKSTLKTSLVNYVQQRNRDDQVDGVYEVSSQTFTDSTAAQLDVLYSIALVRKNFLVFKKTELRQYRASARVTAASDCGDEKRITYSFNPVNR